MALLELLAGPAPARVVAADLLLVGDAPGLDLLRRLGRRVGRVARSLRHTRGNGAARHGRRRGLQRAGLVRRRAARVVEGRLARASAAADGPLLAAAVLALDLDLDVEDVARELLPDVVH